MPPEDIHTELVPVTLTFDEWALVAAALIAIGRGETYLLQNKIAEQVIHYGTDEEDDTNA